VNKIRLLLTSLVLAFPSLALAKHPERHYRSLTAPELTLAGAVAATVVVILSFLYLRRRAARQGN